MPIFFQLRSYLTYWLDAVDEHSLHSPFFYDFYTKVIKGNTAIDYFSAIKTRYRALSTNKRIIEVEDLGSVSILGKNKFRSIADITRTSVSPLKFSFLYSRIITHIKADSVIELGSSIGINTLFLASSPNMNVTTFEGSTEIASIALSSFKISPYNNIKLIRGNINETLPGFIDQTKAVDFIFMDANHQYESTLRYFNMLLKKVHHKTVIVVDDIHYSAGMGKAWNELKNHSKVYGSIDLYRCGILFFEPNLNKQHVVLKF